MKKILFVLLFFYSIILSQNLELKGRVIDNETEEPLISANVYIYNSDIGTTTNFNGYFFLNGNFSVDDTLLISYVGYKERKISVKRFLKTNKVIKLQLKEFRLKSVVVRGIIAEKGTTPATFSKIERKDIEDNYTLQDLPEYLSYLPSTTFYSENGNGLGYNYLSIRGFGQRRISISVNGIPQNDPEDHNVYWLDMPDLLESAEMIQVQRGAGAGAIGYPSIGGSINIITSPFSDKANFEISSSIGSYNTRKYSAKFSSGLIDNKYSIYAKLSKTLSDGYRNNSWIDFNSYHLSAVRYDKNVTTQINLFGGPISDGLAFYGLPKEFIKDKKLRKTNFVQPREIENFSQPHYELLNEIKLSNSVTLNNAIFYIQGDGFFDYDGSWSVYYDDYFRLKENGYGDIQVPTNALIHAEVNNKQWGVIPRISWEHVDGTLIAGVEYRRHRSEHWGGIRFAENIPENVPQNYQYYYYEGAKDILNVFANENYNITDKLNILGELQVAYHKYKLFNEKYLNNVISIDGLYLNPRIGLNYKFNNFFNSYISFARVTREPRLKNYYDAAESSGGATPQFELSNGEYNFNKPLVKPETMNDIEVGARYANALLSFDVNLFYMLFNDEIVKKGQLDRFGQPITGNIEKTIHAGIEIEGQIRLSKYFSFIFNTSFSRNRISEGSTYLATDILSSIAIQAQKIDLSNNEIAGFPDITMNAIFKGKFKGLSFELSNKYVGEYFTDNYDNRLSKLLLQFPDLTNYTDNRVDAYFVMNFMGSYEFELNPVFKKIRVFVQVNNIFDNLYATYATGGDFFPAAERNFLIGLKLGL